MKYLFMLLIASGSFVAASAQGYDRNGSRTESFQRDHDRNFNDGFRDRGDRIAEVNRIYEHRIWEVKNNNRLSRHQQRKMVRELNKERDMRIRDIKAGRTGRY